MPLPDRIEALLQRGIQAIDPQGELPGAFRSELYLAIEETSALEHENAGYYRRARMELSCAYKVLPMLEPESQIHEAVQSRLAMAEQAFRGIVSLELLNEEAERLAVMVDDAQYADRIDLAMMYAGFACVSAMHAVACDIDAAVAAIPEKSRDHETWHACFYASLAVAGTGTWEDTATASNSQQRRAFWIWYLQVLIPAIWNPLAKLRDVPMN